MDGLGGNLQEKCGNLQEKSCGSLTKTSQIVGQLRKACNSEIKAADHAKGKRSVRSGRLMRSNKAENFSSVVVGVSVSWFIGSAFVYMGVSNEFLPRDQ